MTMSLTGRSAGARNVRMSRRFDSAMALKTSAVAAALGTSQSYSHNGICQPDARTTSIDAAGAPRFVNLSHTGAMVSFIILVVAVGLAMPARAARAQTPASTDDAAVREVVRRYVDARELRDPRAIEALFTADADQHTSAGEWRRGRAQVVPGTLESSTRNPGARAIAIASVRFITPDVAIADGPYEISSGGTTRRMWTTLVLKRERDGWRIAAIRNMLPSGGAAPPR
jgi:uncharacterized protein (TIGR02246 family)